MNYKIVNVSETNDYDFYVGRQERPRALNHLGNPYVISPGCTRDEACRLYADWLRRRMEKRDNENVLWSMRQIYRHYKKYGSIILACHCAPKRCHAEEIIEVLAPYFDK